MGVGQDEVRCAGQQAASVIECLPAAWRLPQRGHLDAEVRTQLSAGCFQQGVADAGRTDPAASGKPPAAMRHTMADQRCGGVAFEKCGKLGRQLELLHRGALQCLVRRVAGHLQHAAGRPA